MVNLSRLYCNASHSLEGVFASNALDLLLLAFPLSLARAVADPSSLRHISCHALSLSLPLSFRFFASRVYNDRTYAGLLGEIMGLNLGCVICDADSETFKASRFAPLLNLDVLQHIPGTWFLLIVSIGK